MRRNGNVLKRLAAVGLTAIMLTTQVPAVAFGSEIEETIEQESGESDTAGPEISEPEIEEPGTSEPETEEPEISEPEKPDASVSVSGNGDGRTVSGDEAADNEAAPDDPADNVSSDAFEESKTIDGVKITVSAESGAFPEGDIHLSVNKAGRTDEEKAETAVEEEREKDVNVAASYTYDIKILDNDGNEIEPADGAGVKVSFKLEEVADSNLMTNIYHIKDNESAGNASEENPGNTGSDPEEIGSGESNEESVEGGSEVSDNTEFVAKKLTVETEGDTATAETDGFSLYTVEFTYESKQYVLPGDSEITLSEILDTVGLAGEVTDVKVSDETLFSASDETGEWIVTAHQAFSSNEWMKVSINGMEYEITVTDDQTVSFDISSKPITINSSNRNSYNGRTITGSINKNGADETYFFTPASSGARTHIDHVIEIDGVEVNLTIKDLSIVTYDNSGGRALVSPIELKNGAILNLTLKGSNTLTACFGGAGISVPKGCTLNIYAENNAASLIATGGNDGANKDGAQPSGGAGIGIHRPDPLKIDSYYLGTINIHSGNITARGGSHALAYFGSAGIGGSEMTREGSINISGGTVTAEGGAQAAAIGGAGSGTVDTISITGGTVTATADTAGCAIGCGYEGSKDEENRVTPPRISITGGKVTANGNIGHPDAGEYVGEGSLTISESAEVTCTRKITCPGYANHEITINVYGTGLSAGESGDCEFWIGEESAHTACSYSVTAEGSATKLTAKTKRIVKYGSESATERTIVGNLSVGNKTYYTEEATINIDTMEQSLYSGYLCTLSGTVYDTGMPSTGTKSVSISDVTPVSSSVDVSGSKATVSAVFVLPEAASLSDEGSLSKTVTVSVGNKTYTVGEVSFEKSGPHKKKGRFSYNEGGYSYIDKNGVEQFKSNSVTVLDGSQTALEEGWYAVPAGETVELRGDEITIKKGSGVYATYEPIKVTGDVHLILCDGSTANASCGIVVEKGNSLTIYGQSKGTGVLNASCHSMDSLKCRVAIGSGAWNYAEARCPDAGNIYICGGVINATSNDQTAIGGGEGGDGGQVTIIGGKVTAKITGDYSENAIGGYCLYYAGSITKNSGAVTLSWNDPGMELYTTALHADSDTTVTFQKPFVLKDSPETLATRENMGGKTIVPGIQIKFNKGELSGSMADTYGRAGGSYTLPACGFTVPDDREFVGWKVGEDETVLPAGRSIELPVQTEPLTMTAVSVPKYSITGCSDGRGTVTADLEKAAEGKTVKLTVTPENNCLLKENSLVVKKGDTTVPLTKLTDSLYSFTMPDGDVTVSAEFVIDSIIHYVDAEGNSLVLKDVFTTIAANTTAWGNADKTTWYVASETVTTNSRPVVTGDVNLILFNGKTLTAKNGITVPWGSSLTIWAESTGESMGKLIAKTGDQSKAGIGSDSSSEQTTSGRITINGGHIEAAGGNFAAGIGGSSKNWAGNHEPITINGGDISSQGGELAAGIGAGRMGNGNITITGGKVYAEGGNYAPGIGSGYDASGGTISITGGEITAKCTRIEGAGIGGGAIVSNRGPSGGTIEISGGKVEAVGGCNNEYYCGAGIGGGYHSSGIWIIRITGGSITSSANGNACAIGAGDQYDTIGNPIDNPGTAEVEISYTNDTKRSLSIKATGADASHAYGTTVKVKNDLTAVEGGLSITGSSNALSDETKKLMAGKTLVPPHTHKFTYSADGATITGTCADEDKGCRLTEQKATITIKKPAHETYGDGKAVTASISGDTDVLGTPTISYYKGTTKLDAAPSEAGTYTAKITLGAATASLEYTIAPIAVTVKADNKSKVYDKDTSTDPKLTATVTGAVAGDTINYSLGRKAGQNAGNYKITVTLDENPNYAVTAESGTFSITPKSITVSADNKTKTYDNNASTDPALTATVTGAAAGDTINYSLGRAAGQAVGSYDITVTPGSNPNYTVNVVSGSFSIEKAAYPANRPQENIETDNQNDKVSKVALPSGWQWSDADKDRGLNVNEPVTVSANYIAADKANYIEDGLVCNVTIKRNPTVNVTKVTLNKTTATIVKGKTLTLTATVAPSNATNKGVTWSSSNTKVATVNSKGVVTAVAPGAANITVTTNDGKKTAVCKVTVTIPVTGVKLNKSSASIVKGKTLTLTAAVAPSNATNKAVTWSSSNTKVATVSTKGVVKAVDGGSAVITVTTADGKKTAKCTVKVIVPVTGVKLNKTKANVARGYTMTLTPTITPSNATNKAVSWKSSNTKIATVNSKGVVAAVAPGTANITVTTNDGKKTATCKVTVVNPTPVKSVKLNKTKASVVKGYTITLTPTVSPSNATNKAVTWKSSNTKIATVTSAGVVKGVKAGTANITVTTKDGKKTAVCTVTVTNPVAVKSVKLNAAKATVAKGKTYTLKATINPTNATNKAVTWKSSNTKIATVTSKGVVKGIAKGTAKITVTTTDGKKTAVCTVTVK